jgi:16S rRNA (guanine527-N7)-methyltransferase
MTSPVLDLPAAPDAAAAVFGDRLELAVRYAELLAGPGVERGLVGPRETPRLWERHLLNCVGVQELLAPDSTVLDLGAGAGLPGLVLAIRRPDVQVVLVEALGLDNVSVRRARAEELARKVEVDVVTARAVAPLDRLVRWSMPLLTVGGRLLALKGDQAEAELATTRPALKNLGGASAEVVSVGTAEQLTSARVVVVERGALRGDKRPSRGGGRR